VYLGCVGLALAVFGAVAAGRKWRWTALGLFAALLLLALGGYTPLLRVLAAVPGFGLFRGLSRFTAPMSLFFGLLAGAGADALLDRGTRRWLPAFAAVALLAATMWAASIATARPTDRTAPAFWTAFMRKSLALGERPASYHDAAVERSAWFAREAYRVAWGSLARSTMLISVVAVAAGLWRWRGLAPRRASAAVALAMACDFWCYGRPYLVTFDGLDFAWSQESVQYLRQVREPFRVATGALYSAGPLDALVYGVPCVEGVEPNVPLRFRDLFWRALDQPTTTQKTSYHVSGRSQSMHLLRLLGLRFLLSPPSEAVIDIPGAHTVHQDKRVRIDELPGWLPRARLAFRSRVVPDPQQALEALTTSVYERETILDAPLPYREPWAGPIGPSPPPEFVVDQPERVVLRCQAVCPSFLVLGDVHYPGWRARLDGRPTDILRADYLLRAVAVPAGRHEVEFTYEPESFRVGAWASGVGWAALAAALAVHAFLRRRMRHGNDK
jgi:hypothetical protein